jgi:hypothetical protein
MKLKAAIYEDIRSEAFGEQMHYDWAHQSRVKKTNVLETCSASIIRIDINNLEGTGQVSETMDFDATLMQLIISDFSAVYKNARF